MEIALDFGMFSEPLKEQLRQQKQYLPAEALDRYCKIVNAINYLMTYRYITPDMADGAFRKLIKDISKDCRPLTAKAKDA